MSAAPEFRGVEPELIVVDDGSDDETRELLAAVEDPHLPLLRFEESRGDSELVRALRHEAQVRSRAGRRLEGVRLQLRALAKTRSWGDLRRLVGILVGERARHALRSARPAPAAAEREPLSGWMAPYVEQPARH